MLQAWCRIWNISSIFCSNPPRTSTRFRDLDDLRLTSSGGKVDCREESCPPCTQAHFMEAQECHPKT